MNSIRNYFTAEKYESILFVIIGLLAVILALYFLFLQKENFYKGMALPLLLVGLIQITVGSTVWIRSPKDIERVEKIVKSSHDKIQSEEIPRMEVVMKNFVVYRWVEIFLILLGASLFIVVTPTAFWRGLGLGLSIQAMFMLALDYFAESRGKVYLEFLTGFSNS